MRARALAFAWVAALATAFTVVPAVEAGMRARPIAGLHGVQDAIIIPPEWAGIWSSVDSTYDCSGALQGVQASIDTLCSGKALAVDDEVPYAFVCTGTTTATTVDMTCTYSEEVLPDCAFHLTITYQGTRTGESFVVTNTVLMEYVGTGEGCDFLPDSCTRTVLRGTRTGPEPAAYCATPAAPSTWGRVKSRYR